MKRLTKDAVRKAITKACVEVENSQETGGIRVLDATEIFAEVMCEELGLGDFTKVVPSICNDTY